MRIVLRSAIVVLATLVGLVGVAGPGTAAQAGTDADGGQVWGFVGAPGDVDAGWQGPLVISWRNASEETRSYDVRLVGLDLPDAATLSRGWTITAAPGESFRVELPMPRLSVPGVYRARLLSQGVDLTTPLEILVRRSLPSSTTATVPTTSGPASAPGSVRVLDVARHRSGLSFRVSRAAQVSTAVVDPAGRTLRQRSLGRRAAGRTIRTDWDGRPGSLDAGRYTVRISAVADGRRTVREVGVRVVG